MRRRVLRVLRGLGHRARRYSWDRAHELRDPSAGGGQRSPVLLRLLQELAPADGYGVVHELGCGTGTLVEAVIAAGIPFRAWHGFDVSGEAVARAAGKRLPSCSFQTLGAEEWDARPGTVELVVIEETLYYLRPRDQRRLLARALRAARLSIVAQNKAGARNRRSLAIASELRPRLRHETERRAYLVFDSRDAVPAPALPRPVGPAARAGARAGAPSAAPPPPGA